MTDSRLMKVMDGNEAAADIAFRLSEVCAIYPITPSSTMAELADQWKNEGRLNLWGDAPCIMEMQSEGGAAGALHGALQSGSLSTTFTASQGLMLMIPNMHKIAGELTPTVFHVAARSLAAQALSIFGDHQDVMAVRNTGFALLASASVQEAHDMALVAHAATLQSRIPFVHFFDGFRTSHEVNKIETISDATVRAMISDEWVREHRRRSLTPENPIIRGTAQNPDVYFQGRESVTPYYQNTGPIVQQSMNQLAELTGRQYQLVDYFGAPDADRVVVLMGSAVQTARAVAEHLNQQGERVGVIAIRLYRPFPTQALLDALPASVTHIAVLDRTKEPGSFGEPLYLDVVSALSEAVQTGQRRTLPVVLGGRYGLSSKEFDPSMVATVFAELTKPQPKRHFTVGIIDDVSQSHLEPLVPLTLPDTDIHTALFYGLGADGTVGANKNSIKIINQRDDLFAQGYFVYDSKKSGSQTVSHLRYGRCPIDAPYLIDQAGFVAIHQFNFVEQDAILAHAKPGATVLLNAPYLAEELWSHLPVGFQETVQEKQLSLYTVDAYEVARATNMGRRINTIMQTCFFYLADILPQDDAIALIKAAIEKTYRKKGQALVDQNFAAVDQALAGLHRVQPQDRANEAAPKTQDDALPDFVRDVTMEMVHGRGDLIPVSLLPADGTYPSGTTQYEKRRIAQDVPIWDPDICIQCGNCVAVCPHAAIRSKFYHEDLLDGAPAGFRSTPTTARGFPETQYTLQVYAEDCTGCELCVEACPVRAEDDSSRRAINMTPLADVVENEVANLRFFEHLPYPNRSEVDFATVRGVQYLQPLFEFSGACAGCGETPYLKMASQLFGDRMLVANATGCSSIYGGNLPTTPWAKNSEGRGPAWSNSLFEDNAEFGLGFRLTADHHREQALKQLEAYSDHFDPAFIDELKNAPQQTESQLRAQRARVDRLLTMLDTLDSNDAKQFASIADHLVRRSVWIVGGDGWAYDIGYGGLDHVLASGRDVNILVMDTEVYSNTGGQMSKATPLGAAAKFSVGGKPVGKKDLALQAIAYGNVYVARVALGANPQQTLQAFREAESYPGPSIILAYSHCIAHGISMNEGLRQQKLATASGHWPLLRYNPLLRQQGLNPFELDSLRPSVALKEYRQHEGRYQQLMRSQPEEAERLLGLAKHALELRWDTYEEMAMRSAHDFIPLPED
ncbi:pyruvate:ferredoxin (flavodoxin) oxidoreductase [Reinekea blandensis]|uniref:Pyruvate-flavodoxin oxidoreductase n=1 Tax=Reinekea blandensis MED297 TaxID=314283 RepID=A4B9X1_9GAMM|nr:pyruvate:ferredoxin (flavodoxin) oxidoreductase [Reinekea blandensis]EAR11422.1 pyruvate ferredoxin/flavodoxin oxidoreductase family protein [Reinekea sp. MED297] [Reinekea blandensis MED297]